MSSSQYGALVLTTMDWFENCLQKNCTVFHFPPGRNPRVNKLSKGGVCLVLAEPAPKSKREDWLIAGEFIVRDVKRVDGESFRRLYASRAVELPSAPFPKPKENAWVIEFDRLIKYDSPPRLGDCKDIRTSTSKLPLSMWVILGFSLLRPEDSSAIVQAIRNRAMKAIHEEAPSHDELINEIVELGVNLSFIAKKEEETPDKLYRVDVTWRDSEDHSPLKAFEVEMSGNVDIALSRLMHAFDKWRCEQLWLVVSDESRADRARKLVEPKLRGAFSRIKDRTRVISWREIHELYKSLKPHKELLRDLARRPP